MILGVFVGNKGKAILGLGIKPSFCIILIGAGKAMVFMLRN